eukprot:1064492-Rhodomonas_salina.2
MRTCVRTRVSHSLWQAIRTLVLVVDLARPYINTGEEFPHPLQANIMADAAQQAAAAGADALGTLLQGALNAVENPEAAEEPCEAADSSADEECKLVQMVGGEEMAEKEQIPEAGAAAEPAAAAPVPNPPQQFDSIRRGRGRGVGLPKPGRNRRAAGAAAPRTKEPKDHKQYAEWGDINKHLPFRTAQFQGKPGPTNYGERFNQRSAEFEKQQRASKLFNGSTSKSMLTESFGRQLCARQPSMCIPFRANRALPRTGAICSGLQSGLRSSQPSRRLSSCAGSRF